MKFFGADLILRSHIFSKFGAYFIFRNEKNRKFGADLIFRNKKKIENLKLKHYCKFSGPNWA